MTPIPDVYDYIALGLMAPDPDDCADCTCDPAPLEIGGAQHRPGCREEPDDGTCAWCGDYPCRPDCGPPSTRGERPDGPQGAEHYMDVADRYGEEEG